MRFALRAELDHLISEHVERTIGLAQGALFKHRVRAIVAQPADVAAAGRHDLIEQAELGVASVQNIGAITLEGALQHGPFIVRPAAIGRDVADDQHLAFEAPLPRKLEKVGVDSASLVAIAPHEMAGELNRAEAVPTIGSISPSAPMSSARAMW